MTSRVDEQSMQAAITDVADAVGCYMYPSEGS